MAVGNGVAASPAGLGIDPKRDHAAGPLAVLYSVQPDEDPLVAAAGSPSRNSSTIGSTTRLRANSRPSSPFSDHAASALANLERTVAVAAPIPSSPNRSLLSAFQAVSPRTQAIATRPTSAPSLSHLAASPRGVLPAQHSPLGPASPINTSPRQSPQKSTYATAAFRALNGASPQKQSSSRSSSNGSGSQAASLSATANVSPVRSIYNNALRQGQNEAPTWTIYRDADAPQQGSCSTSSVLATRSDALLDDSEEEGFLEFDEDADAENDENSSSALQLQNSPDTAGSGLNDSLMSGTTEQERRDIAHTGHRRASSSTSSFPPVNALRQRDVTPPPSASCWREATQGTYPRGSDLAASAISSSAQRARKRLRVSGDLPI